MIRQDKRTPEQEARVEIIREINRIAMAGGLEIRHYGWQTAVRHGDTAALQEALRLLQAAQDLLDRATGNKIDPARLA